MGSILLCFFFIIYNEEKGNIFWNSSHRQENESKSIKNTHILPIEWSILFVILCSFVQNATISVIWNGNSNSKGKYSGWNCIGKEPSRGSNRRRLNKRLCRRIEGLCREDHFRTRNRWQTSRLRLSEMAIFWMEKNAGLCDGLKSRRRNYRAS